MSYRGKFRFLHAPPRAWTLDERIEKNSKFTFLSEAVLPAARKELKKLVKEYPQARMELNVTATHQQKLNR